MSMKNEVQSNQSKAHEATELNKLEQVVIRMFRQLDDQGREDIARFLDALLAVR
ncbi:hypothetical protein [Pseudomonas putida]|uniref:hypothetical protein n=1 Tax=Pseudomonas putida TaxID=303 RepID=UPI002164A144|nr:hypothetical protein [Pseudomonas putida]